MKLVLLRLVFIKVAQISLLLLIPLQLVQSLQGERSLVLSRFIDSLPLLMFGLLGGVIVDRFGAANVNRWALFVFVIPPLVLLAANAGLIPRWTLIPASLIVVSVASVLMMCSDRLVLDLISKPELAKYNAIALFIERSCSLILPPSIGAVALRSMDAAVILSTALAGFGSIALAYFSPVQSKPAHATGFAIYKHLADGFRFLTRKGPLLQLALIVMLINGMEAIALPLSIIYASNTLNMNAAEIGILSTIAAASGMVAAAIARKMSSGRGALFATLAASIFVNAFAHSLIYFEGGKVSFLAATGISSFSQVFTAVAYRTIRQDAVDKRIFGVVNGALGLLVKLAIPLGILTGGAILITFGIHSVYATAALAEVILGTIVVAWTIRQISNPALEYQHD